MHIWVQVMVHLRVEKYTTNSHIALQKDLFEIPHERVYRAHLKILLKVHVKVQTNAKAGPLNLEGKGALFSAPYDAQKSADRTTINVFEVRLMVPLRVHLRMHLEVHLKGTLRDLNKDAPVSKKERRK